MKSDRVENTNSKKKIMCSFSEGEKFLSFMKIEQYVVAERQKKKKKK